MPIVTSFPDLLQCHLTLPKEKGNRFVVYVELYRFQLSGLRYTLFSIAYHASKFTILFYFASVFMAFFTSCADSRYRGNKQVACFELGKRNGGDA